MPEQDGDSLVCLGRSEDGLKCRADPFKCCRIHQVAPAGGQQPRATASKKPYLVWKKVNELVQAQGPLKPELKAFMQFAFNW